MVKLYLIGVKTPQQPGETDIALTDKPDKAFQFKPNSAQDLCTTLNTMAKFPNVLLEGKPYQPHTLNNFRPERNGEADVIAVDAVPNATV
jgi:hypothetical protein